MSIEVFTQHIRQLYPDADQRILPFLTAKAWCSFRINTLLTTPEQLWPQLQAFEAQAVPGYAKAFVVPQTQRQALLDSKLYQQGCLYAQDLASMLPVMLLDPQPGEEILDLCAAPGSKTTQIASHMQNQGRLAAVEKVKGRFFKLQAVLKQQGVSIANTYLKDGASVYRSCQHRFDRVLVDAPCSSESRIQLEQPESYRYWSLKKPKEMAKKQWPLLHSGFQSLKPGGRLVYSTCTYEPLENEQVVAKLLKRFPQAQVIQPTFESPWFEIERTALGWRVWPNSYMCGFFVAVIEHVSR